jgi:hypothetical protein
LVIIPIAGCNNFSLCFGVNSRKVAHRSLVACQQPLFRLLPR